MRLKQKFSSTAIILTLGFAVLGLAACGGGSDDEGTTSGSGAAAVESSEGETSSEDSTTTETGEDTTAPSGDAVRSAKVEIEDFAYNPDPVTVEEGGKVIWVNRDSAPHTATAEDGSFDTGTLDEGKLKSENFKEAGTYAYVCSIHPQRHGTVEVVAAG